MRLLAFWERAKKKLFKHIRFDLAKTIQQKLKSNGKIITKTKKFELSGVLVNLLGDKVKHSSPYRKILRELEVELAKVILNETDQRIKFVLAYLMNPDLFKLQNTFSSKSKAININTWYQTFKSKSKVFNIVKNNKINLPINIKANWTIVMEHLKSKGFLNKKGWPARVARLTTLNVFELIYYFRLVFYSYLAYYWCVDNFARVWNWLYWYFKYSLISTIKSKFKLGSRSKVFQRYGSDIKCLDHNKKEITFTKWKKVRKLKRKFLTYLPIENLYKFVKIVRRSI